MSIYFLSSDPERLLASFTQEIGSGEIKTWRYKVTEKTPILRIRQRNGKIRRGLSLTILRTVD